MALQPYKKQNWIDHQVDEATSEIIVLGTPVDKIHLDHIESGIQTADSRAIEALNALAAVSTQLEEKPDSHIINTRPRDPDKPDYGIETKATVLRTGTYTGTTEIALQIDEVPYDAQNMTAYPNTAPSGTVIIKRVED